MHAEKLTHLLYDFLDYSNKCCKKIGNYPVQILVGRFGGKKKISLGSLRGD